ncbi:MAG TPA: choice-of-anchor Q domain-containing protein, partial [Rhodanobacteraceae bacterium]|nr:choice-of-anchor Q domain-containing protein [Rhodanobacteraceae bacterium]
MATIPSLRQRPLALTVALVLGIGSVNAATITVTDGGDAGTSTTCTLRQALETTSTQAAVGSCTLGTGNDTVQFASGLANTTIALGGTPLTVANATVNLVGSGQTLDANGGNGVLLLDHAPLTLSDATVTGSVAPTSGQSYPAIIGKYSDVTLNRVTITGNPSGGMLATNGNVSLTDSAITNNGSNLFGGLIAMLGNLSLVRSVVSNNAGAFGAAGVVAGSPSSPSNTSQLTMLDSSIANNRLDMAAKYGGGGGSKYGGAGGMIGSFNTATITGSSISGNSVAGVVPANPSSTSSVAFAGMMMAVYSSATITNTTIAANTTSGAMQAAGGLAISANPTYPSTLNFDNVTVSGNTATAVAAGPSPSQAIGGMMVADATTATINLNNTIVAGNTGATANDILSMNGNLASVAGSLLGNALASTYPGNGNVFSDAPGLGALANNGGLTQTLLPLAGSPALDAGNNALVPMGVTTDQRGVGFPRIVAGTVDIGA